MAEFPIMPMHWDAYFADTTHLTTLEHGAYLLLLGAMWRAGGSLPNDDKRLARFAGLTNGQWTRAKLVIWPFLRVMDGIVTQDKLLETLDAVRQRSRSAKKSASSRWLKKKGLPDAFALRTVKARDANQNQIKTSLVVGSLGPAEKAGSAEEAPQPLASIAVSSALAAKYTAPKPKASDGPPFDDLEIPLGLRRA